MMIREDAELHRAQRAFRSVLDAFARPGTVQSIELAPGNPARPAALDAALEEGIQNINNASSAAAGNTAKSRALTALRAVEGSPKGLGTGAVIGIVAACVVVAAGAVTAGVLIGKKKKAKKDGE